MEESISRMRIPGVFLPDGGLENKIKDLKKGHKVLHKEEQICNEEPLERQADKSSAYNLVAMAEQVAWKLGGGYYKFPWAYNKFNGKKTKLRITFNPSDRPYFQETLKVYFKKGLFRKEKVLEFFKDHKGNTKLEYVPGGWEEELRELYDFALIQP